MARLTKPQRKAKPAPAGKAHARSARATSCGGVVLRNTDDGLETCLGKRNRVPKEPSWTLPKGTPYDGETVEQTALREVAEETGLEVRISAPVGSIEYYFTQSGTRVHKIVHFFLMEPIGGSLDRHDHEFDEVQWFSIDEARQRLTYPTEQQVFEQALAVAGVAP